MSHCPPIRPLSSPIVHLISPLFHLACFIVITLPFHLISALSLHLLWPSCWNCRKRVVSPLRLPSRSVSGAVIVPVCVSVNTNSPASACLHSASYSGLPACCRLSGVPGDVDVVGQDGPADLPGEGPGPCYRHCTATQHLPEGGGLTPRGGEASHADSHLC